MIATTLHQIEVTSHCNLRCAYCLHPVLTRKKQHMSGEVWREAMRWLAHFVAAGTQGELNLNGTGEPTLNPRLPEWTRQARAILGPAQRILLTTNGIGVTPQLIEALKPSAPRVYVTLHQPEKAELAVHLFGQAGLLANAVMDPVVGPNNWAGQVNWPDRVNAGGDKRPVCPWLSRGWLFLASDGTFYSCCYANGDMAPLGHVDEPVRGLNPHAMPLCASCWQRPPHFRELSPEVTR